MSGSYVSDHQHGALAGGRILAVPGRSAPGRRTPMTDQRIAKRQTAKQLRCSPRVAALDSKIRHNDLEQFSRLLQIFDRVQHRCRYPPSTLTYFRRPITWRILEQDQDKRLRRLYKRTKNGGDAVEYLSKDARSPYRFFSSNHVVSIWESGLWRQMPSWSIVR